MKFILLLFFLATTYSCKSSKNNTIPHSKAMTIKKLSSSCPTDGECFLKIEKNKQLALKNDYIGKLYYELVDDSTKSVIIYEYSRKTPKDLQDASYREEIVFEILNSIDQLQLTNSELGNLKMLFGKHCFCRGQAGYYPVKQGKIELENDNNSLSFTLNFTINEVPQIINSINNKSPK